VSTNGSLEEGRFQQVFVFVEEVQRRRQQQEVVEEEISVNT
jgi:hypothetical protein